MAASVLLLGALCLPVRAEQADSVLGVDAVGGSVTVEHLGTTAVLKPGDRLNERDVVRTGADGRLSVRFARLGFFELGPNTEIGVEKLPFASYAADRKSIFSLSHGYLRVVWKHLPTSASWPLYVYFGGQRAGLGAGEYFFDQRESATRVCVAAGQIAVVPVIGENVETLLSPSCTQLIAGTAPESQARDPDDWIAVRRDYSVDATARSPVAAAPVMQTVASLAALEPAPETVQNPKLMPSIPSVPLPASAPQPIPAAPVTASSGLPSVPATPTPARPALSAALSAESTRKTVPPPPAVMPELPARAAAVATVPPPVAVVPAAAPASTPAVAAALPPTGDGHWTINVASYAEGDTAARQVQQLQAAGYRASVQSVEVKGQTWHRVQLRGYSTPDAARTGAGDVEQKFGFHNLWVVRQP